MSVDNLDSNENLEQHMEDTQENDIQPDDLDTEEFIIEDAPKTQSTDSELDKQKKLNAELLDKLQRTLAEFDNFRKRTAKEKLHIFDDGVRDTIEKLLPVVDNFERALDTFEDKEDSVYKGVSMIYKQFQNFLTEVNVLPMEAVGETFNTTYHFAVAHIDDDKYGENEVIEELQKGYKHKEKVIRCSMVKVAN